MPDNPQQAPVRGIAFEYIKSISHRRRWTMLTLPVLLVTGLQKLVNTIAFLPPDMARYKDRVRLGSPVLDVGNLHSGLLLYSSVSCLERRTSKTTYYNGWADHDLDDLLASHARVGHVDQSFKGYTLAISEGDKVYHRAVAGRFEGSGHSNLIDALKRQESL